MKPDIQANLFKLIKTKLSGKDSLGNALSEILHLSPDAVYRRYRGETSLSIQELKRLCDYFELSFDALAQLNDGKVIFEYPPLKTYDFSMESYLEDIAVSFKRIKTLSQGEMTLSINNVHLFQLLNFPQLVRFRLFFWAKTHLQIDEYKNINFKHEKTSERAFDLGKEILQLYNSIPTTEIIDPELMRGFMRNVYYYYKSQLFEDPEYALFLCDRAILFTKHLKEQATTGKKYIYGTSAPSSGNDFYLYLNETINADNTYLYSSREAQGVFITHNVMNYLHTSDSNYVSDSKQIIEKQLANSSLISIVNEKERNNYFFNFEKMILSFRKMIEADLQFYD